MLYLKVFVALNSKTWGGLGGRHLAKYAWILKNTVALRETVNARIFLMKDLAAVEEAVGLGAAIYMNGRATSKQKQAPSAFGMPPWFELPPEPSGPQNI